MRIRKVERSEVGQKRLALAEGNLSLVIGSITVGLIVITAAFFSQGTSSLPANPNDHSNSLSSSSVSSSNSTVIQSAAPSAVLQYPLMWAPNSPTVGGCDTLPFCIYAKLGFSGIATLAPSNHTSAASTTIQGNATTIVRSSLTTIIQGVTTSYVYPPENGSYPVAVFGLVQDAVTGQNVTTGSGQLGLIGGGCLIQPTGFTECLAGGSVPPGHTYKITVFVTKTYLPCSIRPANLANLHCESQLLAPLSLPITVTE
jgi:hypothetical protein